MEACCRASPGVDAVWIHAFFRPHRKPVSSAETTFSSRSRFPTSSLNSSVSLRCPALSYWAQHHPTLVFSPVIADMNLLILSKEHVK